MSPQSSNTASRHAWEWPDCPECESNVFVAGRNGHFPEEFLCRLCETRFDAEYERGEYP